MNEQTRAALNLAHEYRLARAAIRAEIMQLPRDEGLAVAADLIERPSSSLRTLPAFKLLGWVKWIGRYHAHRIITRAGVSELTSLGSLTDRQRKALSDVVRGEILEVAA